MQASRTFARQYETSDIASMFGPFVLRAEDVVKRKGHVVANPKVFKIYVLLSKLKYSYIYINYNTQ